jgi:hypothetical protein
MVWEETEEEAKEAAANHRAQPQAREAWTEAT